MSDKPRRSDEVARMLAPYEPSLKDFISGNISADDFEARYLATFKSDENQVLSSEFDILDGLFADIDDYVADNQLRAEAGGIDAEELRNRAAAAYGALFSKKEDTAAE